MQDISKAGIDKKTQKYRSCLPDNRLHDLLFEKNPFAWNCIYDKYAPLMYGNILNIIKNKKEAEKVFVKAFRSLKEENKPVPATCSLTNFLCMYAKKYADSYVPSKTIRMY